jgi:hypothetical protein
MYLRQLQNHLVERVFLDQKQALEKELYLIAEENQKLLNANAPTFMFNDRWCPYEKAPSVECNKTLHPSLRERVAKLFECSDFEDRDIRIGIQVLIANALTTARHSTDLYSLLPVQFTTHLPAIDNSIFDIGDPLSEAEITAFNEINQENLKFLKRLLITQLLTAKI